jgi:hypothetical protein
MRNRILLLAGLALVGCMVGCAQFPKVDATISDAAEAADYPELLPLQPLLSAADAVQIDAPATQSDLTSRVDRLRSRAARLNGAGMDQDTRSRLEGGLQ